jgi:hypothetical protein
MDSEHSCHSFTKYTPSTDGVLILRNWHRKHMFWGYVTVLVYVLVVFVCEKKIPEDVRSVTMMLLVLRSL